MQIQAFKQTDTAELAGLFRETVRSINSRDYSTTQIEAWASAVDDEEGFRERLSSSDTLVACMEGRIVGFINLLNDGQLDCLYVHPEHQRQGIASALLKKLEARAREASHILLRTEASITALPFFRKHGFMLVREQDVAFGDETFRNFMMKKNL